MEADKKTRISPRIFARPKYKDDKAREYIEKHISWLKSHSFLQPILDAYELEEIDHTATLYTLQEALLEYHYACEVEAAEKSIKEGAVKSNTINDAYTITIFCNVSGGVDVGKRIVKRKRQDELTGKIIMWEEEEDMIYGRPLLQRAIDKANAMLVNEHHSVFAEVINNYGPEIKTYISRTDAFAVVYGKHRGPYMKNLSKKTAPLKNYQKSKNDHARGPWENFNRR